MQGRRWKWSTALVLLGVVACGDDAMELLGDAMVGVGDSMVAVGDAFVDVGDGMARDASSDAAAQPPTVLEAPCEVVGTKTTTALNADGSVRSVTVETTFGASFDVDFDPRRDGLLRTVVCSHDGANPFRCPPDSATSRCEQSGLVSWGFDFECVDVLPWVDEDRVFVRCGGETTVTPTSGAPTSSRSVYSLSRLIVSR